MKMIHIAAIASAALLAAAPAAAEDLGLKVSYRPVTADYCIRPHREDATLTSGVRMYRTECKTRERWAREGVRIERRGVDAPRG